MQIVENLLNDKQLSDGFLALALQLPSEGTLLEAFDGLVDPVAMHFARSTLRDLLACTFGADEQGGGFLHLDQIRLWFKQHTKPRLNLGLNMFNQLSQFSALPLSQIDKNQRLFTVNTNAAQHIPLQTTLLD